MKSWLITGGTGSFGKAFTRKLLDGGAERVVILSRDELKQAEMRKEFNDDRLRFFIGSVIDMDRVELAMQGVSHVVHAAAMKRVEVCEENPREAVATNLIGTSVVAEACRRAGVKRCVFLSTDKAAAPNTLYGMTKASAERLWCRANVYSAGTDTRFAATRYGNVLGSRGSVVPIFRAQARLGGPLTITEPEATRFWMTMDEACQLVAKAFRAMRGGEVFIPKVGSSAVGELAHAIAPGMAWKIGQLGAGEKLHETLISEEEARATYDYGDHYRIEPQRTWETKEDGMHAVEGTQVPPGFVYRSDTNPDRLDPIGLVRLVA